MIAYVFVPQAIPFPLDLDGREVYEGSGATATEPIDTTIGASGGFHDGLQLTRSSRRLKGMVVARSRKATKTAGRLA
jgi:hypothetical protein